MSGIVSYSASSSPTSLSLSQHQIKPINYPPKTLQLKFPQFQGAGVANLSVKCSSTGPGGPGSGETDGKSVVDAFFLGKALAEAINERIESTVGELLSTVGRLQAEQQKQVQDFQEDVLERAKKAKEKAAREAMEEQRRISKSTTATTLAANDTIPPIVPSSVVTDVTPKLRDLSSGPNSTRFNGDPLLGMFDDE